MKTLVVCNPEPVAMEGMRSLMEDTGGPLVVAAETNLEDAASAVADLKPGLLLVDERFGAEAVLDCVRLLRAAGPPPAVIVWGSRMSQPETRWLLEAGVSGVVSKTASLGEMAACVRAVASGGRWTEGDGPAFVN